VYKGANPDAISLIKQMLTFDPAKRITIEGALESEYMKELHFPSDEPTRGKFDLFDFEFEKYDLSGEQLKELLYEETQLYHSKDMRRKYEEDKRKYASGGYLRDKFGESIETSSAALIKQ
jgi:serine/threonine protein kinase